MVEMVVCTVLLSVVAAILAPALHGVKRQRIANRFETLALIELNNIAAKLQANDRDSNSPELSQWFTSRYSDAKLNLKAIDSETTDPLIATKITISRKVYGGEVTSSQSLTTWIPKEAVE